MTASGYIKVAILMGVVCIAVIFWLVYRLLQIPSEQQRPVALQLAPAAASAAPGTAAPAGSATPTATAANAIFAVANAYPNVHTAAGLSSPTRGVLSRGERAEVIGRTQDSVWLEIRYPTPASPSGVGWVSADLMTLSVPVASLPVASSP